MHYVYVTNELGLKWHERYSVEDAADEKTHRYRRMGWSAWTERVSDHTDICSSYQMPRPFGTLGAFRSALRSVRRPTSKAVAIDQRPAL